LVGYVASIHIAQSGSADPGEWNLFVLTELAKLPDIPTSVGFNKNNSSITSTIFFYALMPSFIQRV
jgi:hypothetical protein